MKHRKQLGASLTLGLVICVGTAQAAGPVYPLKPSANGRYLVDQANSPCLLMGDSPQALVVNISEAEADGFFADRGSYGFNSAWVNLLCATYTGGRADASTIDGVLPFTAKVGATSSYDLTQPNEQYFSHVDRLLQLAAQHGIQLFLDPAETGSFLSVMKDNGTNRCRAYGQYLGNRYKDFPNIIWMSGNDFQSWRTAGDDAVVRSVALGIRDKDTNHLHTTELDYLVSSSLDDVTWTGILGLNATYTYFPTYARLLQDYARTNFLPTFMVEANYEFESLQGPLTTPSILRKEEYWTMTSGACGQLYGNHYTWPFSAGWQGNLDTPGALQVSYLKAFFQARAWFELVPDTNHTVVTAGFGTFSSSGHVADNDYLTAARTPDGRLVVIYTPVLRQFTVNLSNLSGPAVTRWFDPSSGTFSPVSGSPLSNSGTRDFTPPGDNSDGDGGWVLVLETNPPPDAPPPASRPRFVQQAYATPQTSQVQVSVTFQNMQSAGNAVLLAVGWNDTSASITGVTDSMHNLYESAVPMYRGNGLSQAIYFAVGTGAGSNTITVSFDRPAAFVDLRALEYAGLAQSNALDVVVSATGTGVNADSGSISVTSTNELLFAAGMTATTFTSSGGGFTQRVITAPDSDIVEDRIAGSIGMYNATAGLTSGAWLMQLASFKAAQMPVASPTLRIQLTDTNTLILAWPAPGTGFVLQENSFLTPTNWSVVTNAAILLGSEEQVMLPAPATTRFYRLGTR